MCAIAQPVFSFSLLPFPLLDDPQPRKAGGKDHHDDQNGVLYHWSALSYWSPIKIAVRSHSAIDPHQELLAFHDLDWQLEVINRASKRDSESLSLALT